MAAVPFIQERLNRITETFTAAKAAATQRVIPLILCEIYLPLTILLCGCVRLHYTKNISCKKFFYMVTLLNFYTNPLSLLFYSKQCRLQNVLS